MCLGYNYKRDKIGNLLILLSEEIKPLYITKLLKLLYLIDEESIKKIGIPVTWLDYKAWKLGPVSEPIYNLKFEGTLNPYVELVQTSWGTKIVPASEFDDSEFSDYEIDLVKKLARKYRRASSEELISITHKEGGPWDKVVREHNLTKIFNEDEVGISPFLVDLSELIKDQPDKLENYSVVRDSLEFEASLMG
ncbi:Panacea domain-containing protein [Sunxiuqinia sp. A32]|uniref:Panacea domain-containing protein n=1 Tax=Sunxiuqinia sp. A32 TaxID=3461496 RepID=UPI0040465A51